jgi:molybdopterin-guanine dinucleotide biosynthesis protein A
LEISGIILAGGKGLRLGRDKALETINGRDLLHRVVSRLSFLESDIVIVATEKQRLSWFGDYPGVKIVTDIYPDKGPLGGIYTGLVTSDTRYNLVVACDMPFLSQPLLGYMVQLSANFDLVIPRWNGLVEPLHAVYSKDCLAAMESTLKQGILSVTKLLSLVRVRYVEAEEIERFDPKHLSFFNVNTEADLAMAKEIAREID